MRIAVLLFGAVLLTSGCEPGANTARPVPTTPSAVPVVAPATPAVPATTSDTTTPAPDNTAVNKRDLNGNAKTPINQDEDETSIKTTAEIRKQVVAHSDFSVDAQNIKIITGSGKVTLRGPVKTQDEKDAIDKIARDVAGKDNVDNQIEVAP